MSLEQYYAPVPQVDRGQGGHLGAGVLNFPVQDSRNSFKPVEGEGQSRCTIRFYCSMIAHLFSILYFYQIQVFLAIFQEQAFSKSQVKIPGGGQRDCATLATVKQLLTENNDIMCTASLWKIYHHDVHTGWFYNHLTKALPCSFLWRHHLLTTRDQESCSRTTSPQDWRYPEFSTSLLAGAHTKPNLEDWRGATPSCFFSVATSLLVPGPTSSCCSSTWTPY